MIRLVELFAGIGSQAMALRQLGLEYTAVVCEIDKHAYAAYCAIHGDTPNLGDITKVEHLPDCDLLTYSFPCQDLSVAGLGKGMEKGSGTRSSLLWEVGRLLDDARERDALPGVLLMENVDAILNRKNRPAFMEWVEKLRTMGYTCSWKVLNAKDFGVPQSRKRCFMVSTRDGCRFRFPQGFPLERRLRDVLEEDVDESFYLSEEKIAKYQRHRERHQEQGHGLGWRPSQPVGTAPSVLTSPSKGDTLTVIEVSVVPWPAATAKGYMDAHEGDGLVMNRLQTARGTVQEQKAPTLTTGDGCGTGTVVEQFRIRYLTPRECWRLMGFPNWAFDRARDVPTSKTQLYKQAGNSIVVDVLMAIFKGIYIDRTFEKVKHRQMTLLEVSA